MKEKKIIDLIVKGIKEKKGKEIVTINLSSIQNIISDYFIVCHGDSNTQVEAITDEVERTLYENLKEKPLHKEGKANAIWILLDYGNIIVHVFQKDTRFFYNLEGLWADGVINKIEENYN